MNNLVKFLQDVESFVPKHLFEDYDVAYKFARDNFGDDDCEEIQFEIDNDLKLNLYDIAHAEGLTFTGLVVKFLEEEVARHTE